MKKVLVLLFLTSVMAFAHTTTLESGGFGSGFLHPISGLDHILAMIGVGMVAFFASKKGYLTLFAFMGAMILSAIAGYNGFTFVSVEEGILISIAVVFGLIGFANRVPISAIVSIVAFFGLFHGFAHGIEFEAGNFNLYILGFSLSTLLLHLSGVAIGYLYSKLNLKLQSKNINL